MNQHCPTARTQSGPTMMRGLAIALLVSCAWPTGAQAAPTGEETQEQDLIEDIKAQEDPTILKSRAWFEAEWNDDRSDISSLETTLGGRKGWRISDNHDWALQVELPFRRIRSEDIGGNSTREGFADIKLSAGTAVRLSDTWRIGGGLELRLPTADRELSGNIWRLQEFVAVAWDATPWLSFTPKLKYFHTLASNRDAAAQRYMEIYLPATFLLPDHWSVTSRYEAKVDFKNDRTTHAAKLSLGKQLRKPELGFSLSGKVPINRSSNQYQLIFNATKYF